MVGACISCMPADVSRANLRDALGLGIAVSLLGDTTLYTILPTRSKDAGITVLMVGMVLAVNRAVRLFFNGVCGYLYDRFPNRPLFIQGLILGALSTFSYAYSHSAVGLILGRILWGMAWSLIWVGSSAIVLKCSTDAERGRWTGLLQTWFFLGCGASAVTGGALADVLGYRQALWVIATAQATSVVAVSAIFLSLPESLFQPPLEPTSPGRPKTDSQESLDIQHETVTVRPACGIPAASVWAGVCAPQFCLAAVSQAANWLSIRGVLQPTLGLLVQQRMVDPLNPRGALTLAGFLSGLQTVVSMAAAPLVGYLSDVLRSRWRVIQVGLLLGVVAMVLLSLHSRTAVVLGVVCGAVMTSALQSMTIALAGDLVDVSQRGRAASILITVADMGSALGPACTYSLLRTHGLSEIYLGCAAFFGIVFIVVFPATRHHK
eukprot:TRINITY_DN5556_c0_g1_i1.p1 TRINITY_DN5556_c0_g1~~TRINITY_DN5556_c0_g1_i1.p1  ORF type:complete len:435 (+),score=29.69 TRINITY_DN5556_c0_g1_i1:49-1353(+)